MLPSFPSSTSSKVEQSSGSKVQQKTDLELQFEIEQRRNIKQKSNILKAEQLKPYLMELSQLVQSKDFDGLQGFYIKWATQIGLPGSKIAQVIENKAILDVNQMYNRWTTFAKVVYNMYLQLFEDCNKKQRGLKFKQTKYQFEKTPESKDAYTRIVKVMGRIEDFIQGKVE
jgi:hypothetical protein